MSEEIKTEEKTCFCQNKYFKKFLVIAIGSFTGVYLALSLFAATHKPCFKHHHPHKFHAGYHHMYDNPKGPHGNFQGDFNAPQPPQAPKEAQKTE